MMWSFIFVGFIALFDQMAKAWILSFVKLKKDIVLIQDFLSLSYIENRGAAFGILKDCKYFFIALMSIILIIYLYIVITKKVDDIVMICAINLTIGGGLGNFIDRIRLGYVVDYIRVSFFPPVFNLADCCITVGTFILLVHIFFLFRE